MAKKVYLEEMVNGISEVSVSISDDGSRVRIVGDGLELASFTGYYNASSFCRQLHSLSGAFWWSDGLSLEIMSLYISSRGYGK